MKSQLVCSASIRSLFLQVEDKKVKTFNLKDPKICAIAKVWSKQWREFTFETFMFAIVNFVSDPDSGSRSVHLYNELAQTVVSPERFHFEFCS